MAHEQLGNEWLFARRAGQPAWGTKQWRHASAEARHLATSMGKGPAETKVPRAAGRKGERNTEGTAIRTSHLEVTTPGRTGTLGGKGPLAHGATEPNDGPAKGDDKATTMGGDGMPLSIQASKRTAKKPDKQFDHVYCPHTSSEPVVRKGRATKKTSNHKSWWVVCRHNALPPSDPGLRRDDDCWTYPAALPV